MTDILLNAKCKTTNKTLVHLLVHRTPQEKWELELEPMVNGKRWLCVQRVILLEVDYKIQGEKKSMMM